MPWLQLGTDSCLSMSIMFARSPSTYSWKPVSLCLRETRSGFEIIIFESDLRIDRVPRMFAASHCPLSCSRSKYSLGRMKYGAENFREQPGFCRQGPALASVGGIWQSRPRPLCNDLTSRSSRAARCRSRRGTSSADGATRARHTSSVRLCPIPHDLTQAEYAFHRISRPAARQRWLRRRNGRRRSR